MTSLDLNNLTDEEILELADRNNSFVGKTLRLEKRRQYVELLDVLQELLQNSAFVKRVTGSGVNKGERNSNICVDFTECLYFSGKEAELYKKATEIADHVAMSVLDDGHIRMTFVVADVWSI